MPDKPTLTKAESEQLLAELLADLDVRLDAYEQYLIDEMVKQAGGVSVQTAA